MRLILAFILSLQWAEASEFTWAARQMGPDTVVVVSYPSDGINLRTCLSFYSHVSGEVELEHRWTPRHRIADIETVQDYTYKGYLVAMLRQQRSDGSLKDWYAWPVRMED